MQKYALGELNVACPQNNKCQRCGYLPQQTQTDTHSGPGKIRKGRWSWALTVSWKLLSFIQVPTPGLSDTVFVTLFHTATERASCFTLADPTSLTYHFFPLYKQKLLSGSSQMTFTLSLMLDSTVRDNMWAFLVMWWDRVTVKQWWRVKAFTLKCQIIRAQELCESQGGCPGLPSLINLWFLWT